MAWLSFSLTLSGGEVSSFISGSSIGFQKDIRYDGMPTHLCRINGIWLKNLKRIRHRDRCRFCVVARVKKGQKHEYPWPEDIDPNLKSGHLSYLSSFKALAQKPKPVTLAFEKPLVELEEKIIDVRKMADETGLDFSDQINLLESKYQQALKDLYRHLTPFQRLQIARHPNRPTCLDHVFNITDKFVELHGDRAGYDDPAIVCGIGSIDGQSYMFIGHQKGRNTKENIQRNFGMPTPHGYRKALRLMRYADHHGFPIITLIDTPGAFADLKCEELGQGEAIAFNLREMFGLKVPIVSVVIGEGGSGGALAIGCANKLLMLENSVFYVASPEACAAILWKSSQAAPKAAEKLRITAPELCKFKVADGIIPEPLGGAHTDPSWTSQQIKIAVTEAMEELKAMDPDTVLAHRQLRHRHIGGFIEGKFVEPERKRNMKQKEVDISDATAAIEVQLENLKKKAQEARNVSPGLTISEEAINKLREEVDKDMTNTFISMGLKGKLEGIKLELSKSSNSSEEAIGPVLKEKVDRLVQEFNQKLSRPGSYLSLKQKLEMLNEVSRVMEWREKGERLKKEMNENLKGKLKEKVAILNKARQKVALGEQLDDDLIEEVQMAKAEMAEALKSLNLNLVGIGKKMFPTAPPNLREKIAEVDEVTKKEIEKAVIAGGLRGKIAELKEEIRRNASKERIEELEKEIRDGIVTVMDAPELKKKIESLWKQHQQASVGADSSRG